jgi:hypothetical protein
MSGESLLYGCTIAYLVLIVVDAIHRRSLRVFSVQLGIGVVLYVLIVYFLRESLGGRKSFGGEALEVSHLWTLGAIVVGAVMGILARYVFDLERRSAFDWFSMLKPLCISPIVVIPLLATTQGHDTVAPFQVAMFWLLSFQNGFFWQAVLEKVRSRLGND